MGSQGSGVSRILCHYWQDSLPERLSAPFGYAQGRLGVSFLLG